MQILMQFFLNLLLLFVHNLSQKYYQSQTFLLSFLIILDTVEFFNKCQTTKDFSHSEKLNETLKNNQLL